jgi:chaperone modulatory protein CbpM
MKMKSSDKSRGILSGELLEPGIGFSADELCRSCTLQVDHLVALVQEGVLEPRGGSIEEWRFELNSVRRVRTALRLQRDLGVNLAGAALALELLDRINELENRRR